MTDLDDARKDADPFRSQGRAEDGSERLEQKLKELAVFREREVLTEAEVEEQKARLPWGLA